MVYVGVCTTQTLSYKMKHKLLWDFDIQTNHLNLARRPDLTIIEKKKTWRIVHFTVPANHKVKSKESEKKRMYLDQARVLEKTVEHESDGYTNCNWCPWYSHRRIDKGNVGLGSKRTSGDHPNYCIIEIEQNSEKSPGDLRRLADTQTPVKNHQLTLMWKTLKE